MTIWFTSDTHFFHNNIINYCKRPFACVDDMNAALADNWCAAVKPNDMVYFLGDFCIGHEKSALDILGHLPGQKFLISGNHDMPRLKASVRWAGVHDYLEIQPQGCPRMVLCHYPFTVWNGSHNGSINLHGHSHGTLKNPSPRQFDVGVDCWNYELVPLATILEHAANSEVPEPRDHHGGHT